MTQYVFPGLQPFIDSAARAMGVDLGHFGRTKLLWHCTQIQNALGQLPRMPDKQSQIDAMTYINAVRDSLACAVAGIDSAILDATSELELPLPEWAEREEGSATFQGRRDEPRRLRGADAPGSTRPASSVQRGAEALGERNGG